MRERYSFMAKMSLVNLIYALLKREVGTYIAMKRRKQPNKVITEQWCSVFGLKQFRELRGGRTEIEMNCFSLSLTPHKTLTN